MFDGIAYGKTASVLHMLEEYLGHDAFRAGVNLYLKEHAYGNASAADFWNAMARSSGKPIDKIMPTFVMQPGEPYVGVEAKCEAGNTTLNLSQKRYLNTPSGFNEPNDQLWQIPICAKGVNEAGATKPECFLLTERQQQFTMKGCSKLVFPNAGALGYYRFDYDSAALHQLGNAIEEGLTPEERIALVGDEWALMRIGQHNVGDYLALGAQLEHTPGSVLLSNYFDHLDFINQYVVSDVDRSQFESWLRKSFAPALQQLGYTGKPTDAPEVKQKRAVLFRSLGNIANDPEVIQQARTLVQQYMKDSGSVDGTLASAVIAVAARHGDAELYNQFKAQMKDAKSPEEYYRYFYALAEFPQTNLIQQTLDWTLTPEVRGQDLFVLFSALGNPNGQTLTWDFMRQHYDEIEKKTGGGLGGMAIFMYAAPQFCDAQKREQVEQFFQHHSFPGTERNQKEAVETIDGCIALRGQQTNRLAAWLKQGVSASASASGGSEANSGMRR
jgi:aminopeptidase N/puromycin-sensitive aminopeptidase